MKKLLSQNIDKGTANAVGVAFAIVGDAGCDGILQRAGGSDRSDRSGIGQALRVSARQRIAAAGSTAGCGGWVVGCDANIHNLIVAPLWRICKQPLHVVMQ